MFTLTGDQRDLVAMVTEFTADTITPYAREWDRAHHFPADVLRKAADLGMGGIYVPESSGGSGLSRLDAVLVIEALAAGCPSTASYLSIHNMVAWMVDTFGDDDQRARVLAPLLTMEHFGSYCLTEPDAGSDAAALSTRATRTDAGEGADYLLNGVKQFISGAGTSQTYVVMARTADTGSRGISAFLVDRDSPGLSFGPDEVKMGWNTQPTRQVVFEDVRVPAADRLGEEGEGFRIAMSGLNGGRLNIAASSLGGASAALAAAIGHLGERHAFGGPIGRFQALQFQVADMATDLEAARTFLWRAAAALDDGAPDMVRLCAMAKRFVTDVGFRVANDALQLHGGYGYLAEYGIEKIVRDLRVHQILEGTNEIMRLIISRDLLGRAA